MLGVSSLSSEPLSDRRRLRLAQIEKGSQTVCGVANWLCYLLMLSAEGVDRNMSRALKMYSTYCEVLGDVAVVECSMAS